jgi:replication factor C subunit 1
VIDEDGLFAIIKKSGPPSGASSAGGGAGGGAGGAAAAKKAEVTLKKVQAVKVVEPLPTPQTIKHSGKASASDSEFNAIRKEERDKHNENLAPSLWVDKYRPNKLADLLGNGDKRLQLRTWLARWGSPSASSGGKQGGQGGKADTIHKAVLMHGPPGIGKSSSARVVIESCGYTMVELNASDVRNKAGLQEKVASLTQNQSINTLIMSQKKALQTFSGPKNGDCTLCGKASREHFHGTKLQCYGTYLAGDNGVACHICGKAREDHYGEHKQCYGTCLVMDEVDGMSAGDRGGVTELIAMIKKSRVPIICIANDGYSQKLKSLRGYCIELKFSKPMHSVVVKRLRMIAEAEGFDVKNENALEKLYLSSGNDIRHVITALQTWRMRTSEIKYDEVSSEIGHGEKDASVRQTNPFEVVPSWFLSDTSNKDKSFRDRMDMFFYDTDLMPLFVQENYAKVRVSLPKEESYSKERGDYNIIRRMAEAAENISQSDLVNNQIRKNQNWGLLPLYGNLSTISAGFPIRGNPPPSFFTKQGVPQLTFPGKVLGHQSTMGRKNRLAQDLARCMKYKSFANASEVAADYLPVLRHRLCAPLISDGVDGVEKTMAIMDEYLLSKEEFDVVCTELRLSDIKMDGNTTEVATDWFGKVDSKVKAALTRGYNKESHSLKFSKPKLSAGLMTKGKGSKGVGRSGEEKDSDDDYEEEAEGEEEDEDAADAKKKGPTLPTKPAKGVCTHLHASAPARTQIQARTYMGPVITCVCSGGGARSEPFGKQSQTGMCVCCHVCRRRR